MARQFSMPGGGKPTAEAPPEDQPVNGEEASLPPPAMGRALFYDTETTGLPLFKEPSEDPRQPHIVQLAATLVDLGTRQVISSIDLVVHPTAWEIPAEVTAIHGISTELATAVGVAEHTAVDLFLQMWTKAHFRVAHNETFDARIIRIQMKRYGGTDGLLYGYDADVWKAAPAQCTQVMSTPILKLPPTAKMVAARRNHHKSANLGEAFEFFTGKPLEDAHRAIVDVLACQEVYFAIKDRQELKT